MLSSLSEHSGEKQTNMIANCGKNHRGKAEHGWGGISTGSLIYVGLISSL